MDSLLLWVIEAHGGIARWSEMNRVAAQLTVGGPLWGAKGQPDAGGVKTVEADTRQERIGITPFGASDWDLEFTVDPERVVITDAAAEIVDERADPRASFGGSDGSASWDVPQTGYVISYALWNYLTQPFLLSYPGVHARELEPWEQDNETWRRLHVTFPPAIATHSREQIFYFDQSGMQRRIDYVSDVDGGLPLADYAYEPKTFDGIVAPTRRRVRDRSAADAGDTSREYVTIDIHHLEYHRS